jgi:hypothetical protein
MDIKSILFGFLLGIVFIVVTLLLIIYIANRRFIKKSMEAVEIDNSVVKGIISNKQKRLLKSHKTGIQNNFRFTQNLTKELVEEIASYYYPTSKYPALEINISEALDLTDRVTSRLKSILDVKALGPLQQLRISQIVTLLEWKKNLENNAVYRFSKKMKLEKVAKFGYTALNIANPAYWLRRVILTGTIESTLRGIGVMTLNVVGEESSQLYSKKIIDNRDKILDKEFEKLLIEIEQSEAL